MHVNEGLVYELLWQSCRAQRKKPPFSTLTCEKRRNLFFAWFSLSFLRFNAECPNVVNLNGNSADLIGKGYLLHGADLAVIVPLIIYGSFLLRVTQYTATDGGMDPAPLL